MIRETEQNRHSELVVAKIVAEWSSTRLVRAPRLACFDFALERDEGLVAVLEIKNRAHGPDAYETLLLSEEKANNLIKVSRLMCVAPMLAVSFDGTIGVIDLRDRTFRLGEGGRTDRNDPKDMESCLFIPVDQFKILRSAAAG